MGRLRIFLLTRIAVEIIRYPRPQIKKEHTARSSTIIPGQQSTHPPGGPRSLQAQQQQHWPQQTGVPISCSRRSCQAV